MSPFIPDASVAAAWCFEDETTPFTEALLQSLIDGTEVVVPVIWRHELANALLSATRQQRATLASVNLFVEKLHSFVITVDAESGERALSAVRELAGRYRLTVYDAAYLELALRRGLPLATFDKDLQKAAQGAGVSVLRP